MKTDILIKEKTKGKTLGVAGGNYRIILSGNDTDQNYSVIEMVVPPGGGPPPHEHPHMQEMFYVLEGEVEFKTTQGKFTMSAGDLVNIPFNGGIHCFQNISDTSVRLLCTVVPAGLDEVFEKIGVPAALGEFPPVPEMTEERKALLKQLDEEHKQTTYPKNYLD